MEHRMFVFCADEYIGNIIYSDETKLYSYEIKSNSPMSKMWIEKTNADKGPKRFTETLLDTRVIPENRIDCREILRRMGLLEYDPWKIMSQHHFVAEDWFWAHEEMVPDWFWTNHFLASYHSRYTEVTGKPMYSRVVPADDFSIY